MYPLACLIPSWHLLLSRYRLRKIVVIQMVLEAIKKDSINVPHYEGRE